MCSITRKSVLAKTTERITQLGTLRNGWGGKKNRFFKNWSKLSIIEGSLLEWVSNHNVYWCGIKINIIVSLINCLLEQIKVKQCLL